MLTKSRKVASRWWAKVDIEQECFKIIVEVEESLKDNSVIVEIVMLVSRARFMLFRPIDIEKQYS